MLATMHGLRRHPQGAACTKHMQPTIALLLRMPLPPSPCLGQASSNLFDGVRDLDGHKLRGIQRACRIGFLSLFEVSTLRHLLPSAASVCGVGVRLWQCHQVRHVSAWRSLRVLCERVALAMGKPV